MAKGSSDDEAADRSRDDRRDEMDELRELVRESVEAAKAAQSAADRVADDRPGRWELLINSLTNLLSTLLNAGVDRLTREIERARKAGEDLVADVMQAISDTATNLGKALILGLGALMFAGIAAVVFVVALTQGLNQVLGAPWGTAITGVLFALLAWWLFAKVSRHFDDIERDAQGLRR